IPRMRTIIRATILVLLDPTVIALDHQRCIANFKGGMLGRARGSNIPLSGMLGPWPYTARSNIPLSVIARCRDLR
ncbi:MAG: hypothetical protein VXW26_01675, partial [SAR324 cluster bacterium]|nr:hypothetical protein [SAR324 cluster bacterium]